MGRRLPTTPRSKVRAALRQLWLRSRERQAALKRDKYSCTRCGVHQSVAKGREVKINVHHTTPIDWDRMIDFIMIESGLMCGPEGLTSLCVKCHEEEHSDEESVSSAGKAVKSGATSAN